jgi:hypothetical protein
MGSAAFSDVHYELFSSSFCGACARTRSVLQAASGALPGSSLSEHDVAIEPDLAEANGIEATPTVIVRNARGDEVFRAVGVPSVDQAMSAAALATAARTR